MRMWKVHLLGGEKNSYNILYCMGMCFYNRKVFEPLFEGILEKWLDYYICSIDHNIGNTRIFSLSSEANVFWENVSIERVNKREQLDQTEEECYV